MLSRSLPYGAFLHNAGGSLQQLYRAINSGTAKIVTVGHSVVEGDVAQMEGYNIWTEELIRKLVDKFPSATFNYVNYGLSSRTLAMFVDSGFLGVANPDPGDGSGFYRASGTYAWQNASVIGKSWMDHVKDESPDLVIMEFGLNSNTTEAAFKANLESAISTMKAWTKPPSIAILSEMYTTENSDPYLDKIGTMRKYGRAVREVCEEQGCSLIDVGRKWELLMKGTDPLKMEERRLALDTFTQITGPTPADTLTFNSIIEATNTLNYAHYADEVYNINVTGSLVLNATSSVFNVGVRFNHNVEPTAWSGGLAIQIKETQVKIFENGSNTQTDSHADITVGVASTFEIDVTDDTITVKIDGTTYTTYTISSKFGVGDASIGGTDFSCTSCVYNVTEGYPVVQTAKYTNNELLGNQTGADWTSGDRADGGNSLNHPSRIGLAEAFYPTLEEFVESIELFV